MARLAHETFSGDVLCKQLELEPPPVVGGEVAAAPTVFLGWLVSVDPRLSLFCYLNADLWLVSVSVWPLTLLRCRLLTEFAAMRTVCANLMEYVVQKHCFGAVAQNGGAGAGLGLQTVT